MVRLKGPGLASSASGSLANTLIFSTNKGRAYVKKAAKPKQPRTPAQVALRVTMEFLAREWSSISASDQATWAGLAAETRVSEFNAYQAYNLLRARNHQRPSMAFPATETGVLGSTSARSLTPGPRCLHIQLTVDAINDTWSSQIYHTAGNGVQPTWDTLIDMHNLRTLGIHIWTLRHLTPGGYWIAWLNALTTGKGYAAGFWWFVTIPN